MLEKGGPVSCISMDEQGLVEFRMEKKKTLLNPEDRMYRGVTRCAGVTLASGALWEGEDTRPGSHKERL